MTVSQFVRDLGQKRNFISPKLALDLARLFTYYVTWQ